MTSDLDLGRDSMPLGQHYKSTNITRKLFPNISEGAMSEMDVRDPKFRTWLGNSVNDWPNMTDDEKRRAYGQYLIQTTRPLATEKTWTMWTLSEADIKGTALGMGISRKLTRNEIEEIARIFKVYVEHTLEDWEQMMRDAIREVVK
jgi:hypothetical protein